MSKITTDLNPDWVEVAEVSHATEAQAATVHIKFGSDVGSGSVWLTADQTVEFSKELGKAMMLLSGEVADELEDYR